MKNNQKSNSANNKKKKNNNFILGAVTLIVVAAAAFTFLNPKGDEGKNSEQPKAGPISAVNENGDIVIPIADVTEDATFYSYDKLDTYMEVLAVKASDGTIRTAFNTCQVCYSSGKGYYVQDGDVLVCQNCGNRFDMDEIEVAKGGCNPVPIFDEWKEVTDSSIIITKDVFVEAEGIFANWKN